MVTATLTSPEPSPWHNTQTTSDLPQGQYYTLSSPQLTLTALQGEESEQKVSSTLKVSVSRRWRSAGVSAEHSCDTWTRCSQKVTVASLTLLQSDTLHHSRRWTESYHQDFVTKNKDVIFLLQEANTNAGICPPHHLPAQQLLSPVHCDSSFHLIVLLNIHLLSSFSDPAFEILKHNILEHLRSTRNDDLYQQQSIQE